MAIRRLYLIRHGQYEDIDYSLLDGDFKLAHAQKLALKQGGLTPVGVEQAQRTAQRLHSLPVSAIHSSTMRRALETAEIVRRWFPGIPLQRTRLLWECLPTALERHNTYWSRFSADEIAQHTKRASRAFDRYFKCARGQDKHELLICHGNLIRYLVCRVVQVPPEAWSRFGSYNCGITEVQINSDGRMWVLAYNDTGHLPEHLRT
jgi:serine/threonine-protein phosphatase PGAM5